MNRSRKRFKRSNVEEAQYEYKNPVVIFLKVVWSIFRFALKVALIAVLVVVCVAGGAAVGLATACISTTQPVTEIQLETASLTSFIYYPDGEPVKYINDEGLEEPIALKGTGNVNRVLVTLDQIPKYLKDAVVAIEDERFYTHKGVDVKRSASAVVAYLLPGFGYYGGSTITQQLIKNATGDDEQSVLRKISEMWRAYLMERDYSKDEILEKYLNIIYLGRDCYGVQSAAKAYFGKNVEELTLPECAYLAGITNNPAKYAPHTTQGRQNGYKRQVIILDKMLELGSITKEEYIDAIQTKLEFNEEYEAGSSYARFSYFVDAVITDVRDAFMERGYSKAEANKMIYGGGIRIYTTQDREMQAIVDREFNNDANFPVNYQYTAPSDMAQAAIVIMDQYTGQVKAMYGGYGPKTTNLAYNYATNAHRQPGSSIKPILVYAPLIDQHIITTASTIDDEQVFLNPDTPDKPWPKNSYNYFRGTISVRQALAVSCNVAAVKLYKDHIPMCLQYLKRSGIDRTNETQISVALGGLTNGVCAMEMCAAYVPFSNGTGIYHKPITFTKVLDSEGNILIDNISESHVVYQDAQTASVMTSLLTSVMDANYSGTARKAIFFNKDGVQVPTAGKTGTTSNSYDYWFVGYSGYYTAAVWYGYPSQKSMQPEEKGAAYLLWKAIMQPIHEDLPIRPLATGNAGKTVQICAESRQLATALCKEAGCAVDEIFSDGTQPASYCTAHRKYKVCLDAGKDSEGRYIPAGPNCTHTQEIITNSYYVSKQTCTKCKPAAPTDAPATPTPEPAVTPVPEE
ncbi:MAG: transglycosylase domain-containing protein [Clostridia bacterium]|nr:transglycosylase domain-containing protein [Clostridia bacterium]MBQ3867816.1 transglycosylase domain-containing protein [Clostridia bacterium]